MSLARLGFGGLAAALALCMAGGATAAVVVSGVGLGHACYLAAEEAGARHAVLPGGIEACDRALDTALSPHDEAGSYVNRGVMHMVQGDLAAAAADFEAGLRIMPSLGEAHVNLGASLVGMHQDREGAAEITEGLTLGSSEPEKAYFNRAIAEENLDDLTSAYQDYMKASELKPDWTDPKKELARFTVEPAPAAAQH